MAVSRYRGSGVSFNGKHSWTEYECYMTDKHIGMPEVQTYGVEVPGRNGKIDLTEALFGDVRYGNREVTVELTTVKDVSALPELQSKLATDLHGKVVEIKFDDDSSWSYVGRCNMDMVVVDKRVGTITLVFDCEPYARESNPTNYASFSVGTSAGNYSKSVTLPSGFKYIPRIRVTASSYVAPIGIVSFGDYGAATTLPSINGKALTNIEVPAGSLTISYKHSSYGGTVYVDFYKARL